MSENNIYEIAKKMSDPDNISSEIQEAVSVFGTHLREKYINPIGNLIEEYRKECITNPNNEVKLLQACRPFMGSSSLDRAIDIFNSISLIQNIRSEYVAQSLNDKSVHTDGIYDIDEDCVAENSAGTSITNNSSIIFAVIAVLLIWGK